MDEFSDGLQALLTAIKIQQNSIDHLVSLLQTREQAQAQSSEEPVAGPKAEPPKDESPARTRINWGTISGEERLAAWQGLAAFVEALVERYNMHLELRPCWWQHADAVEELTALWHAWQFWYMEENNLNAPLMWRMQFAASRDRLRDMFQSCRDRHVDLTVRVWMHPETREAFARMVEADVFGPEGRASNRPATDRRD